MKQSVNFSQFCDAFRNHDRQDQFSYEAKKALFEYLESIEDDTETETELDVIALCCEYSEHESAMSCAKEYDYEEVVDLEPHGSVDLLEVAELEEKQALQWLEDRTTVIPSGNSKGIVIAQF
ncbi:MAG: hypothetical protein AAB922_01375 [Patescibacteria group bacterium]